MKIFNKNRFVESCQKAGATPYEIIEALALWANNCDGKTEEELKTSKLKFEEDWFISEEEAYDDKFR
jgi:hypothetical protein